MSLTVLALLLLSYSLAFTTFSVHAEPGAHARILIDGNSQFTPGNGVVSGSGSAADPYIIANWEIDASAGDGIKVANTDAHFVIRNCAISGGTGAGIALTNVTNGEIEGNTCKESSVGIMLYLSSNNTVSRNTCSNMEAREGIMIQFSTNNTLTNNTCFNNYSAIKLSDSSYTTLTNNNCSYNTNGINSQYSTYNTLAKNTFANNSFYGVYLSYSPHTMITNCSICDNNHGVYNSNLDPAYVATATYCWWGASTGPSGAGPGTGDSVSANVLYDPWLTSVKPNATLTIQSSASNVTAGSTVTMSGSLLPMQSGIVTIFKSINAGASVSIGTAALTNGIYSYQTLLSDSGTYNFYAQWDGNENYYSCKSNTITVTARVSGISTTLSCSVSTSSINQGDSITISGIVSPALSGKIITIIYGKPGGSSITRTATTQSDGSYSDTYSPDTTGSWTASASWNGDASYSGAASGTRSFSVNQASSSGGIPGFPFESIAIGAIAGAIIIYLLRRRTAGPSLILKQG